MASKAAVVTLTNIQNDPNIIGVVSTKPAYTMGFGSELKSTKSVPVALIGRVPVKISLENGEITAGNPLTSSTRKGYAAKAAKSGRIIGYAMEDYKATTKAEKIMVFIQPGWWQSPVSAAPSPILVNESAAAAIPVPQIGYITKVNGSVIIRLG